jgi:hypothetical protein
MAVSCVLLVSQTSSNKKTGDAEESSELHSRWIRHLPQELSYSQDHMSPLRRIWDTSAAVALSLSLPPPSDAGDTRPAAPAHPM